MNSKRRKHLRENSSTVRTRLLMKVAIDKKTKCWEWTGHRHKLGYGVMRFEPRDLGICEAHIISYEIFIGPVPKGKELDHKCRNRPCINPGHLEPVTHAINMGRGHHAIKTHCIHGHRFSPDNTYVSRDGRICKTCRRERQKKCLQS